MATHHATEDLVICGGGLAGASVALNVARTLPDLRVVLLEAREAAAPERVFKVGESIVELASWHLRHDLDIGQHLAEDQLPKLGLRFFMRRRAGVPFDERLEYGVFPLAGGQPRALTLPTYHVDRGRLENHLVARVREAGVRVVHGAKVRRVELGHPHQIQLAGGETLRARFVVDATGARGLLKRALSLSEPLPHHADAAWARVPNRVDVESWLESPKRPRIDPGRRWASTNHLVGDGYWIWVIPLASGATSIGVVTDPTRHRAPGKRHAMREFLATHEPELAGALGPFLDHRVRRGGAYGCTRLMSADGWAIMGDAGFFLDPLYSPGADFIAIQSRLVTRMVTAQRQGEPLGREASFAETLLQRMLDQHLGLYRGLWKVASDPFVMALKVAWDTAAYFAFNLTLFQHALLTDPVAMAGLRPEVARIGTLQRRAAATFARAAAPSRAATGWVDQFAPDFLYDVYASSEPNGECGTETLRRNLETLEHALHGVEARLAGGAPGGDVARLWQAVDA